MTILFPDCFCKFQHNKESKKVSNCLKATIRLLNYGILNKKLILSAA